MAVPMYHFDCGGLVLWRVGPAVESNALMESRYVILHDGRQPTFGERFAVQCPRCGRMVVTPMDLTRERIPA